MFDDFMFDDVAGSGPTLIDGDFWITYNDYYLHDGVVFFSSVTNRNPKAKTYDREQIDPKQVKIYNFKDSDLIITISGIIKSASHADLLSNLDNLKEQLGIENQYLIIKEAGTIRRVRASCIDTNFRQSPTNVDWEDFTIKFLAGSYQEDNIPVIAEYTGITSSPYNLTLGRDGKAEAKIYSVITLNSATSVTSLAFSVDGVGVTIARSFSSADVIIIDGENLKVTVNGSDVGFSGSIPKFKNASNNITLTINGTKNYNMLIQYHPAFN